MARDGDRNSIAYGQTMGAGSSNASKVAPEETGQTQAQEAKAIVVGNKTAPLSDDSSVLVLPSSRGGTIVLDDNGVLSDGSDSDVSRGNSAEADNNKKSQTRKKDESKKNGGSRAIAPTRQSASPARDRNKAATKTPRLNAPVTLALPQFQATAPTHDDVRMATLLLLHPSLLSDHNARHLLLSVKHF